MNKYVLHRRVCILILFCMLLTPGVKIPGLIGIRLEDFIIFLIVFYFAAGGHASIRFPERGVYLLYFIPILLLSITVGSYLSMPTTLLDLSKFIWLLKSLVIYITFYNYVYGYESKDIETNIVTILFYFILFCVLASFICIQQYFNVGGLNQLYIPLIAPSQYTSLMPGYPSPRVVGLLGNPNSQGYVFALSIICTLFLFFKKGNKYLLVFGFFLILGLLMTLSRGALLSCLFGLLFVFLGYRKDKVFGVYKLIVLSFIAIFVFFLVVWLASNPVIYNLILFRFEALSNITEDGSFVARFHGWLINIEYFKLSPVFGLGPLPRASAIFGASDNEWLSFLRAYGVVGMIWLLLFMFKPLAFKGNFILVIRNRKAFSYSILLATCVYMIPAAVITNSGLIGILLALLSICDTERFSVSINRNW